MPPPSTEELRLRQAIAIERLAGEAEETRRIAEAGLKLAEENRILVKESLGEKGPVGRMERRLEAQDAAHAAGNAGLIAIFGHPAARQVGAMLLGGLLSWLATRGFFPEQTKTTSTPEEVPHGSSDP